MSFYKFLLKFLLISISFYLVSTAFVSAALVPCGPGTDKPTCQFCDLAELIGRVINFALKYLAIPLAAVFIAWGGLMILIAGGSTEKAAQGRKIIESAVIGVVIALIAWLFIVQLLSILTGGGVSLSSEKFNAVFCK